MNKSFEDKIRDRLSEYRVDPPAGFRDAILNAPGPGEAWLVRFFHAFGAVLMLISLFMVGYIPIREQADLGLGDEGRLKSQEVVDFHGDSFPDPTIAMNDEVPTPMKVPSKAGEPKDELITPLSHAEMRDEERYDAPHRAVFDPWDLEKLTGEEAMEPAYPTLAGGVETNEIIFKRTRRAYTLYLEGGAFFLYNRIRPNLDDDIYVSDYDAPFGLSASRVGLSMHWGLQRIWSEHFSTRLGLGFNHYNQDFSFNVRGTTPQTVVVESDFVTPIYEISTVQIKKRVSTVGVKIQNTWSFPSRYNSLFASVEYQRIISSLPTFEYEGTRHTLVDPNQYFLELGLRKLLFEGNRGLIHVTPAFKYSVTKFREMDIISIKPFSVGVSVSYGLK